MFLISLNIFCFTPMYFVKYQLYISNLISSKYIIILLSSIHNRHRYLKLANGLFSVADLVQIASI